MGLLASTINPLQIDSTFSKPGRQVKFLSSTITNDKRPILIHQVKRGMLVNGLALLKIVIVCLSKYDRSFSKRKMIVVIL